MRLKKFAAVAFVVPFMFLAACSSSETSSETPSANSMPPVTSQEEGSTESSMGDSPAVMDGAATGEMTAGDEGAQEPSGETSTVIDPITGEEVEVAALKEAPEGGVDTSIGEGICAEIVNAKMALSDAESTVKEKDMVSRVIMLEGAQQEATKDYLANRLNFTVENNIVVKCTIG